MKMLANIRWTWLLLGLVSFVWWVAPLLDMPAQFPNCEKIVRSGAYTLNAGETLNGNLCIVDGSARLDQGSKVNGNVLVANGNLRVQGEVTGDVVAVAGLVDLGDQSHVHGDVNILFAKLSKDDAAQVDGKINQNAVGPLEVTTAPGVIRGPGVQVDWNPLWKVLSVMLRSLGWAALAIVIVLFAPRASQRVAETTVSQAVLSGGMGLMTTLVAGLGAVVLAITLIGIPLAVIVTMLFVAAWALGLVALGLELGRRLMSVANQDWGLPLAAGLGTGLLTLVLNIVGQVPCVGWLGSALFGLVGLGAVVLTRFGTQPYPRQATPPAMLYPPAPPAATPTRLE